MSLQVSRHVAEAAHNLLTLSERYAKNFHDPVQKPMNDFKARLFAAVHRYQLPLVFGAHLFVWRQEDYI